MQGKIVLITGANGGLGVSVTKSFLGAGATVVGVSRKISPTEFSSPNFQAVEADLVSRQAAAELVAAMVARYQRIDVLVHLVGGFAGGQPVHETDEATWVRMRQMNFDAALYAASAVIPPMRAQGGGRIIAIGSKAADQPHANLAAYVVFKSALAVLIRTIALENASAGINANLVLPGTMDTPGNRGSDPKADFSKWVPTEEVANVILWLAGDQANQVNGAAIPVDRNS